MFGRFATEFERDLLDRSGRLPHDLRAGFGFAGERNLVDVRMGASAIRR